MKSRYTYFIQDNLKIIFIAVLAVIVIISMFFTNRLVKDLSEEERNRMTLLAEATKFIIDSQEDEDISFAMQVIAMNTNIPVIVIDEDDNLINFRNIIVKGKDENAFFKKKIQSFKEKEAIVIQFATGEKQYFYYDDSFLLRQLSYFPFIQLTVIIIFCGIVLYAILSTKKAEQNRVWVGLSRETAHQLGTPISSLLAWVEILRDQDIDRKLITEMSKDVNRLRTIAERFSKIGSNPDFENHNLESVLSNAINYMRNRTSQKVKIEYKIDEKEDIVLPLNVPLFEWVIENLCKNAIDAMDGTGEIDVNVKKEINQVLIDVKDNGKGIPKSKFKTIFTPGYTTKKRGWGLGLSLVKRIVEEYHGGKIFVKSSEPGQGTVFRIILPIKANK